MNDGVDFSSTVKQEEEIRSMNVVPDIQIAGLISEVLKIGKAFPFQAKGSSMMPFIKDGDVITLIDGMISKIELGDVVAVITPSNNMLRIHRVVRIVKDSYVVKGDHVSCIDGRFDRAQILGKVAKVEREQRLVYMGSKCEKIIIANLSRLNLLQGIISRFLPLNCCLARHWKI